jgi:hypothetical protein
MLTTGKCIACVVVVDDFFKAFKVAIAHIGLDEIEARPLVRVPQCRDLELAVELRSEPRPIGIRVELRISKKVSYSFVHIRRACQVGYVSVPVRLILVVIRNPGFLGTPRLDEVKSVNNGALLPVVLAKVTEPSRN